MKLAKPDDPTIPPSLYKGILKEVIQIKIVLVKTDIIKHLSSSSSSPSFFSGEPLVIAFNERIQFPTHENPYFDVIGQSIKELQNRP